MPLTRSPQVARLRGGGCKASKEGAKRAAALTLAEPRSELVHGRLRNVQLLRSRLLVGGCAEGIEDAAQGEVDGVVARAVREEDRQEIGPQGLLDCARDRTTCCG